MSVSRVLSFVQRYERCLSRGGTASKCCLLCFLALFVNGNYVSAVCWTRALDISRTGPMLSFCHLSPVMRIDKIPYFFVDHTPDRCLRCFGDSGCSYVCESLLLLDLWLAGRYIRVVRS